MFVISRVVCFVFYCSYTQNGCFQLCKKITNKASLIEDTRYLPGQPQSEIDIYVPITGNRGGTW